MDAAAADKLHGILTRQYAAHEELLRLLQTQQQAVRRFDAGELDNLRSRCDQVAQRIVELEDARAQVTGTEVRLADLIQTAPEPQRGKLAAISAGLRGLAERITSITRVNDKAMRNMLNHFHSLYQIMASAARAPAIAPRARRRPPGRFWWTRWRRSDAMGLLESLRIGASALAAQQAALQVTGNNIANSATPGYVRQVPGWTPRAPARTARGCSPGPAWNSRRWIGWWTRPSSPACTTPTARWPRTRWPTRPSAASSR